MASPRTTITVTHGTNEAYQTIVNRMLKGATLVRGELVALRNFFHASAGGDRNMKVNVQVDSGEGAKASGTITFSSFANGDTFTIGSEVFTCKTSGASGNNEFNIGGTDTLSAAAAVVKINAHPNLVRTVLATSSAAVITVAAYIPGKIGNYVNLAISAHGSVSAATLTGGTESTSTSTLNTYRSGV